MATKPEEIRPFPPEVCAEENPRSRAWKALEFLGINPAHVETGKFRRWEDAIQGVRLNDPRDLARQLYVAVTEK